jgi:hypothetical protein
MGIGCGCLVAIVILICAFFFGPWAVLGWIGIVVVIALIWNAIAGD